jgi:N-acetylglucosamine malate deacetylase 1
MAKYTVLAIGAHPDPLDMAYQCGGTLAKMVRQGHRVVAVSMCGENQEEATRVAKGLEVEIRFLDSEEGSIQADPATTQQVVELIREVQPDLVITHQPTDYNPDHRATSDAVTGACLLARVGEVKTAHAPFKVACLYYSDTTSGVNSDVNVYVDIGTTFAAKFAALAEHKSLSEKAGAEHLGSIEHLIERDQELAHTRGNQAEVEAAEAFRLVTNYRVMRAFETLPVPDAPLAEK